MYQIVDHNGNPVHDSKVLVHSAITLAWEQPPKQEYALHEVLQLGVKVHSWRAELADDTRLAEALQGAEMVASIWLPHAPLPVSRRLTRGASMDHSSSQVRSRRPAHRGDYRLEVELLSEQVPSLNWKIGTSFKVGAPIFASRCCAMSDPRPPRSWPPGNGAAQEPVFAGDRVELLAELVGGTAVDFTVSRRCAPRRRASAMQAATRTGARRQGLCVTAVQS